MSLKELLALNGTSGREESVREYIIKNLPEGAEYKIDPLGNLIVSKKGARRAEKKVMLDAHMDEVGFIVNEITDKGYIGIAPVGGIDKRAVFGHKLSINGITGVCGGKELHNLSKDESGKIADFSDLYIDIGAFSKEEAEKYVSVGDVAYFECESFEYGDGFFTGKAIDDRLGCLILLNMLKKELPYDCTFVFSVQEEVGTRGAKAASYTVNPDFCIVVETTTANDIPEVAEKDKVCFLGKGAVVPFADCGTIYPQALVKKAFETAKKNGIKIQTKTKIAGGNNARAVNYANGGIPTVNISVPVRYLHSSQSVCKLCDWNEVQRLCESLYEELAKGQTI